MHTDAATDCRVGENIGPSRHMLPEAAWMMAVMPWSARAPLGNVRGVGL